MTRDQEGGQTTLQDLRRGTTLLAGGTRVAMTFAQTLGGFYIYLLSPFRKITSYSVDK